LAKLMAAILSATPDGARPDILLCDIAMSEEDDYAALRRAPALQSDSGSCVDGAQRQRRTVARDERGLTQISITKPVDPVSLHVISNIVGM
jgi:hypothetical protein